MSRLIFGGYFEDTVYKGSELLDLNSIVDRDRGCRWDLKPKRNCENELIVLLETKERQVGDGSM